MTDVSVIMTAHREGLLVGASVKSALEAINHARATAGLTCEIIMVLDNASELTATVVRAALGEADRDVAVRILETSEGDPGQARNQGIAVANGLCAGFLDGDDLWAENWISAAWQLCKERPDAVAHSMVSVTFGDDKNLRWHVDSEEVLCDPRYLPWGNYWDALSFARTQIYRDYPFRANNFGKSIGHEDWYWNTVTFAQGIPHKLVPETVHFIRRRPGSQTEAAGRVNATIWPV